MSEESIKKLKEIFTVIFELSPDEDVSLVSQTNTSKWDSLATVSLAAALENEFGINVGVAEALRLTSYQSTLELLEEKI